MANLLSFKSETYWQILLVGENQKNGISELVLVQHTLQLLASLDNTVTIVGINNEDDTLGVLKVMSPQRTDLVLSTNIPYGELNVLVLDCLDVETWELSAANRVKVFFEAEHTDRWDGCDDFTKLQLVQNGGLSGSIQTNHQDSHLLLSPELIKQLRECKTHVCGCGG